LLRGELQSADVPISPPTREGLDEEIDRLPRQVEALKNAITNLKQAREQTAQTIAALRAAEQESPDPAPTYWYLQPVALSMGIESQPDWEGVIPLLDGRQPPVLHRGGLSKPRTTDFVGSSVATETLIDQ
jgi:hypothetical protein